MKPECRRFVNYGETDLPERKNRRAAMAKGTIRMGDAGYWVKRGVTNRDVPKLLSERKGRNRAGRCAWGFAQLKG